MKKMNLILLAIMISASSFAQEFLGVKVDGTKQEFVAKFVAKGFKVVKVEGGNENATSMKGSYGGTNYELVIINTPVTKKVWKLAVYLPEQTSWYSLKSAYEQYLGVLVSKYGDPNKSYNFFKDPYYEGDGYEMSAVALDKCVFSSFWENIYIEISKYRQVKISYENATNSALDDEEKEKINKNVF